jgi:hypothetical protein
LCNKRAALFYERRQQLLLLSYTPMQRFELGQIDEASIP